MSLPLLYKVKVNQSEFELNVRNIAGLLGIDPTWLMVVMDFETGGTFSPSIQNKYTGATGLIQFMPSTALAINTSVEALAKMTNVQQLHYVYAYLYDYRNKIKSFVDLYLAIFFPAAIGKDKDYVLQTKKLSAELIANQNQVFDLNKDHQITVAEVAKVITDRLAKTEPTLAALLLDTIIKKKALS